MNSRELEAVVIVARFGVNEMRCLQYRLLSTLVLGLNVADGAVTSFSPTATALPTRLPTRATTLSPTRLPTYVPSPVPTVTPSPTMVPSHEPTPQPTSINPSVSPTPRPTAEPTHAPSHYPTPVPTSLPTPLPTLPPSPQPSQVPTLQPTPIPSLVPTPLNCVAGYYWVPGGDGCTGCAAGQYMPFNGQQRACFNCISGNYQNLVGQASCKVCEAGRYCEAIATKSLPCVVGTYSTEGASSCTLCGLGKYNDDNKQSSCKNCAAGTYANEVGSEICTACSQGKFSTASSAVCSNCTQDTYQPQPGQGSCLACPPARFQAVTGATSCDESLAPTHIPTSLPTTVDTATVAVSLTLGTNSVAAPSRNDSTADAIRSAAALSLSFLGSSTGGISHFTATAVNLPATPSERRLKLVDNSTSYTYVWAVAFDVLTSLGEQNSTQWVNVTVTNTTSNSSKVMRVLQQVTWTSVADLEAAVSNALFADTFSANLATQLGVPTVAIQSLTIVPTTFRPTFAPSQNPTSIPSAVPSQLPTVAPRAPSVVYAVVAAAFATPTFMTALFAAILAVVCACGYDTLKGRPELVFERDQWVHDDGDDAEDPGHLKHGPDGNILPGSRRRASLVDNEVVKKVQRRVSTFVTHAIQGDLSAALAGDYSEDDEDAAANALPPLEIPAASLQLGGPPLPPPFLKPSSGSGRVLYRGRFEGNTVACKLCRGVSKLSDESRKAFNREVNILADLGHPNVLQVFGICSDAVRSDDDNNDTFGSANSAAASRSAATLTGSAGPSGTIGSENDHNEDAAFVQNDPLVVTALCSGGNLAEYYPISSFFTPTEFDRITKELLAGIAALHARGCAHRDLRPANVLLEPSTRTVKLAGFHLARSGLADPRSAPYAAPETYQLLDFASGSNDSSTTTRAVLPKAILRRAAKPLFWQQADVYSVGLLLWELWFRRPPFEGEETAKLLDAVSSKRRPPLMGVPGAAPPPEALAELIELCWAPNPKERPPMALALRAFMSNESPTELTRLDRAEKEANTLIHRLATKRASITGKFGAKINFVAVPQSDNLHEIDGQGEKDEEKDELEDNQGRGTDVVELPGMSGAVPGATVTDGNNSDGSEDDVELDPEVAALLARLNFKKPRRHSVTAQAQSMASGAASLDRLFGVASPDMEGQDNGSPGASHDQGQGSIDTQVAQDDGSSNQPELFFDGMDATTAALLAKLNYKPKEPPLSRSQPPSFPQSDNNIEPISALPGPSVERRRNTRSSSSGSRISADDAKNNAVLTNFQDIVETPASTRTLDDLKGVPIESEVPPFEEPTLPLPEEDQSAQVLPKKTSLRGLFPTAAANTDEEEDLDFDDL